MGKNLRKFMVYTDSIVYSLEEVENWSSHEYTPHFIEVTNCTIFELVQQPYKLGLSDKDV
jgi:hypothetical protein